MIPLSLQAHISKDGQIIWRHPGRALQYFKQLAGQEVEIVIDEPSRSKGLNRLFHALFQEFSSRTGYSPRAAKEYLKREFIENGQGTSDLRQSEGIEFAAFCEAWIAEHLD